jgi:hypothetical protein
MLLNIPQTARRYIPEDSNLHSPAAIVTSNLTYLPSVLCRLSITL